MSDKLHNWPNEVIYGQSKQRRMLILSNLEHINIFFKISKLLSSQLLEDMKPPKRIKPYSSENH